MVITYYGLSCFKVESGKLTLAFDPPSRESDVKPPRFSADVVTSSHNHERHNGLKELSGDPFLISGPGEYETKNLLITGSPSFHDKSNGAKKGLNTIYTVEMEDIRLCHLGDLGTTELSPETLEAIGEIDILFIPTGGGDVLDPEEAVKVINVLEPKIVIPMHYTLPKTSIKGAKVEEFLEELGEKGVKSEDKFTIKRKELVQDGTKAVVLNPVISL
ncbi:MBL fold metallo-hydrolase [Candidatus Giovannonibacteria bacterium]|nr:MBL fold metallo-hydrolase [Candidatus Giovannonibacteria bacterium]